MLTAMTSPTISAVTPRHTPPVPTAVPHLPGADVASLLRALDAVGLQLRVSDPGKVVSVYPTSPELTIAVTEVARTGRRAVPQVDWSLEFSPRETVLILRGPDAALASLGLAEPLGA
jgi:hypothetical protein